MSRRETVDSLSPLPFTTRPLRSITAARPPPGQRLPESVPTPSANLAQLFRCFGRHCALAEVLARPRAARGRELGTKIRGCTFVHFEQRFTLHRIGFTIPFRFRNLQPKLLGQVAYRVLEAQLLLKLQKLDHIAAAPQPKQ